MKLKQNVSLKNGPSITELAVQLNFTPVKAELFQIAFHHSSYANERNLPSKPAWRVPPSTSRHSESRGIAGDSGVNPRNRPTLRCSK